MDLSRWKNVPQPERKTLEGAYARLEPLKADQHGQALFEAATAPGVEERFRYLFDQPPADISDLRAWVEKAAASVDPLFFAVIDRATGRAEGRQALMRIDTAHGVIEIGNIMWGPAISRTRVATEALFLFADYAFSLGYRRFEWKCENANLPSKRAAERFGFSFEGLFRQHMVVKGRNRDTAWFSILDSEWPRLRAGYQLWLQAGNFDASGQQLSRLQFDQ
ncbi:GNAT family N-acetyltransferase [Insolitispirillum peregrinum]|uniref:GNAT family N-acetyltransferase n=1 Tax=Insolitispirillum peregrinum TaxID=80876 RepID=UPI0009702C6D|nr:GNAT family protein [Insolitispirillum peregrinum]